MKQWEERNQILHQQDLKKVENLKSKYLYKITLILLKYTPITLAIIDVIHTICSYYEINIQSLLEFIGGISILSISFIYVASYTFKFCQTYRIPLYYIIVSNILATYDSHIGINVSDKCMFCIYLIIIGIFILIYSYYHVKNNKNNFTKTH